MFGRRVPILETLGGEVLERGEGKARIRYPVLDAFKNPLGVLQGGVYAVMMDSAMAIAANGIQTAHLQVNILRPAREGYLVVSGEVVRAGRTLVYCEAEVRDEATGELLARGTQNGLGRREPSAGAAE